jgi:hypothetical protein
MALWSVIVYGRTYEADFRFLAIPEDFTPEALEWASKHINTTTRSPEDLKNNPRWCLFKNRQHCVIGVTCMVRELVGSDREYEQMTKDSSGRPLYIFVGYVTKVDSDLIWWDVSSCCNRIDFFKQPLECLKSLWNMKDYQLNKKDVRTHKYNKSLNFDIAVESSNSIDLTSISTFGNSINKNEHRAFIWSDLKENRDKLWKNASQFLHLPDESISFCLGLAQQKDVLEGPFLNATSLDTQKFEQRWRQMPQKPLNQVDSSSLALTTPFSKKTTFLNRINKKVSFISLLCLTGLLATIIWRRWIMAIVISGITGFYLGMLVEQQNHKSKNFSSSKRLA